MQRWKPTRKYWRAIDQLYGNKQLELGELGEKKKVKKKKVKPEQICPSEQQEQFRAVNWIRKNGIICHHSPNGGYRDAREGAKFKRLGTIAGFPDLTLPYARKGYHGLYIEVKKVHGGKLSDVQVWWRDFLIGEGYAWHLAKGADECIEIVRDYFGMKKEGKCE